MDVRYINPFINATKEILHSLTSYECKPGRAFVKTNDVALGDVTGIIGITGVVNGTIAVTFDEKSILTIVSMMFDEQFTKVDEEIIDAVGELTNMVSGHAINELVQLGFNFNISVPTVIAGKNHSVTHHTGGPKVAIPFSIADGKFTIEVSFDK
ncbi:MAG: chemotaxis protein CheX [Desulfobacterales bacterium]|nr:chemotaxis protein CheX [Desulfobacterales bacterium]